MASSGTVFALPVIMITPLLLLGNVSPKKMMYYLLAFVNPISRLFGIFQKVVPTFTTGSDIHFEPNGQMMLIVRRQLSSSMSVLST
jgi:hypothetical protein